MQQMDQNLRINVISTRGVPLAEPEILENTNAQEKFLYLQVGTTKQRLPAARLNAGIEVRKTGFNPCRKFLA